MAIYYVTVTVTVELTHDEATMAEAMAVVEDYLDEAAGCIASAPLTHASGARYPEITAVDVDSVVELHQTPTREEN